MSTDFKRSSGWNGRFLFLIEFDETRLCFQYMHERNVYHGKLHGENILVQENEGNDRLCLVDYAISNLLPHEVVHQLVNGTPSFCGESRQNREKKNHRISRL